jgi:hypothetical protein
MSTDTFDPDLAFAKQQKGNCKEIRTVHCRRTTQ